MHHTILFTKQGFQKILSFPVIVVAWFADLTFTNKLKVTYVKTKNLHLAILLLGASIPIQLLYIFC